MANASLKAMEPYMALADKVKKESMWLSLKAGIARRWLKNSMARKKNIEQQPAQKNATVRNEGGRRVRRTSKYYNLDMILSVGYRVNSRNATYFRKWASAILKDYLLRGYAILPGPDGIPCRLDLTYGAAVYGLVPAVKLFPSGVSHLRRRMCKVSFLSRYTRYPSCFPCCRETVFPSRRVRRSPECPSAWRIPGNTGKVGVERRFCP